MSRIKILPHFRRAYIAVTAYALEEYGVITAQRFDQKLVAAFKRLTRFPQSSTPEPLLKRFPQHYRSFTMMRNFKVIYRYDADSDVVIIVDLWDMRMHPRRLVRQFKKSR